MNGGGLVAGCEQFTDHRIGAMLRARENQSPLDRGITQNGPQNRELTILTDMNNRLFDPLGGCTFRRNRNPYRVTQEPLR
ncbi:MAG: Uncharacterised protein [Hyphomonas sp. TMED17]|nr:MAG: Uncharacterised protein [Hyphomonas sp. TMED17]